MKLIGIYKIQSISRPERIYIGSSINISERWKTHLKRLNKNNHHSLKLQRHYNKYGVSDLQFSIVIQDCKKEDLLFIEQLFLNDKPYFNICKYAGNTLSRPCLQKTKQKMSDSHKGCKNSFYHQKHSTKVKLQISLSHKGLKHSLKTKQKMSDSHNVIF
jgi:group I intron endonuclease